MPRSRTKLRPDITLRLNAYKIIRDAVATGVLHGVRRSFKYEEQPSTETLETCVDQEVMLALCEVIEWESN